MRFWDRLRRVLQEYGETDQTLPELGIRREPPELYQPLRQVVDRLERALSPLFLERLKQRVLTEHDMSERHWQNLLFETKRFFVMAALLKAADMYSREVDAVWHDMLLFTREYEGFTRTFLGEFIHHTPNLAAQPDPNRRAWFDLIYVNLFEVTDFSRRAWGHFLNHPLAPELITDFRTLPDADLLPRYFNQQVVNDPTLNAVASYLIGHLRTMAQRMEQDQQAYGGDVARYRQDLRPLGSSFWLDPLAMTQMFFFSSLFAPTVFGSPLNPFFGNGFGMGFGNSCTASGCSSSQCSSANCSSCSSCSSCAGTAG